MSVASALAALQADVTAARSAITTKGGTVSQNGGTSQLASDIATIPSGGDDEGVEKKDINFYDIDGKRVYSYTLAEALALTAMPTPPDHSNDFVPLTSQGWNWTFEQLQSLTYPQAEIGAIYTPTDGKSHIHYKIDREEQKNISIIIARSWDFYIDYGDGSSVERFNGGGKIECFHNYSNIGEYDISLYPTQLTTDNVAFVGSHKPDVVSAIKGIYYATLVRHFEINDIGYFLNENTILSFSNGDFIIPGFGFCRFKTLLVPRGATIRKSISKSNFQTISYYPNILIESPGNNKLLELQNLQNFSIPPGYPDSCSIMRACNMVRKLYIPEGITTIAQDGLNQNYGLFELHLPASISALKSGALAELGCQFEAELYCKATTPPSLGGYMDTFNYLKIYVPYSEDHSILNAYKTATNWSTHADKMIEYNF